ncbi:hypothetical protein SAMN00017477_1550 [Peptoniphilus asaccharolyticus DSM 20463]|uniref:Uncharacterized protein n=1 Tax=Peptoniphilus asaccharolyticus DSM 20463 TaxID=573058 RepID=A0A1W1V9K2_PEPAS|nr:hypothetical protein [Peptoniphilus asaccharolyticus]MBL7575779.1 hypothetical protein [Peptoniphilus asaccharolyticus]SMB89975.1 hypothetical protein SAMN00017477_1550 [Peptoniphilus asaccharolyticus DSM 20463]
MLFNDLSENVSDLKDNLQRIVSKIEKNSKQLKDQTQLRVELAKEENKLNSLYKKLGEQKYRVEKGYDAEFAFEEIIEEIDMVLARVEAIKSKYEYVKSFSDSNSGTIIKEDKFLSNEKE